MAAREYNFGNFVTCHVSSIYNLVSVPSLLLMNVFMHLVLLTRMTK